MEYVQQFISELISIIAEMSPYLLLGFLFAGILYIVFPAETVRKYMGANRRGAVINASLLGIPLPLCSCGVIPTGISFYKNGASKGSTVSFLISTPQTGIDSILVTWSLLGLPFAIIRPFVALITGIAGGFLTNFTDPEKESDTLKSKSRELPDGFFPRLKEMFRYAFVEFLQDIAGWLIAGLMIAALMSVIIPDNFFAGITGSDLLEMLIILVAAIPVYICATASVPIAAVLMLKGLSPGAALVLLMAGPATNAATITMISRVMGRKALFSYLGSIIAGAMLFGIIINRFMPESWFTNIAGMNMDHTHHLLPEWLLYSSAIILTLLIINGYIQRWLHGRKLNKKSEHNTDIMSNIIKINVEGMTCNHCTSNVENGLSMLEGVDSASANLSNGEVNLEGNNIDMQLISRTVESLGYKLKK
ncbi:MAG: permease [Bacteroidales bacterium]|nr:permease [Bacteroidales bacterium]